MDPTDGRKAEPGLEELRERLRSERVEEREAALRRVNYKTRDALLPELRRLLADPSARVRHRAVQALGADTEAPEAWEVTLEAARHADDPGCRRAALRQLPAFGRHQEAIPVLREALRADGDESVREDAAIALANGLPPHPEVAEALVEALSDVNPSVGVYAAEGLARHGVLTEAVVPRLIAILDDESIHELVLMEVIRPLASMGERAMVPALLRLLERHGSRFEHFDDGEAVVRIEAAQALRTLGPLAVEAVPALLAGLRNSTGRRLVAEAEALERIGTVRAELEELLCVVLPRTKSLYRPALLDVLSRLKPERDASLRELVKALEEAEVEQRAPARTRLWRIVRDRPEVIERIHGFSREEEPVLRSAAIEALRVLGRPTAEALARLAARLESADASDREAAVGELWMLGRRAGTLLGELSTRWPRLGAEARAAVLSVLGELSSGELDEALREVLKAGLGAGEAQVREAAAWALCDFTEVDAELVRLAESLRGDAEPSVREAVEAALRVLGASREEGAPREATRPSEQATQSIHELAFSLYAVLREGEGNRLFSPLSIFTLLAMVLRGTRGQTEAALRRTLHWSSEPARLSLALRELAHRLHAPSPQEPGPPLEERNEGFTLVAANGFWPQEGYPLRAEYLAELAEGFGVVPTAVDFARAREAAAHRINGWAREHTRGRIPAIVSDGQLSELTRYVLANAVYFRCRWARPFYDGTQQATFHLLDGREVDVPMMRGASSFGYARGAGCQLIELPYRGGEASMVVLLPDVGFFKRIERLLSRAWVDPLLAAARREEFILELPRFSFDQHVSVSELSEKLGFSELFAPGADLSGLTPQREPFTGELLHDASITVDEKGTEAAAATLVRHIGGRPTIVTVDRPFLFLIRHVETGALLFLGRVVEP